MKFAICNETFGEWPIEQGFEAARRHNYTGIEVAPFTMGSSVYEITDQQRRDYVQTAKKFELEIIGLHWLLAKTTGLHLTTSDETIRNRTRDYMIALVQLCSDLGGKIMVLGSPLQRNFTSPMTHDIAMANAADVLCQVVPTLEKHGVQIAVEPLGPQEGNFLNHAHQARTLIDRIGSPQVQLHLDVKAMSSEGTPIDSIIRDHADIMIHFHANDPNRLGPGMGDVDQRPIFKALQEIHYQGWVSVEVFDYSPGVETILRESMANMLSVQ
ncbi:MAG: sugar phosphate isomerase/epimerase family protein [Pirellula sp.]